MSLHGNAPKNPGDLAWEASERWFEAFENANGPESIDELRAILFPFGMPEYRPKHMMAPGVYAVEQIKKALQNRP